MTHRVEVRPDAEAAGAAGANHLADAARRAVAERGRWCVAFSGGSTPLPMLDRLARLDAMPWEQTHVFQVDERCAPEGHDDRNATGLIEHLLSRVPIPPDNVHLMPVPNGDDTGYASTLARSCGTPAVLDTVHLGLGDDGHTASLVPDDPVLDVIDRDVAMTGMYNEWSRMTLTYPALNRARELVWLVCGRAKASALRQLLLADRSIPAGRIAQTNTIVFADRAALYP